MPEPIQSQPDRSRKRRHPSVAAGRDNLWPFVVGAVGDFSGRNREEKLTPLKDQEIVCVDQSNLGEIFLSEMTSGLRAKAADQSKSDESRMSVDLKLRSIAIFEALGSYTAGKPLQKMLATRAKLPDTLSRASEPQT